MPLWARETRLRTDGATEIPVPYQTIPVCVTQCFEHSHKNIYRPPRGFIVYRATFTPSSLPRLGYPLPLAYLHYLVENSHHDLNTSVSILGAWVDISQARRKS